MLRRAGVCARTPEPFKRPRTPQPPVQDPALPQDSLVCTHGCRLGREHRRVRKRRERVAGAAACCSCSSSTLSSPGPVEGRVERGRGAGVGTRPVHRGVRGNRGSMAVIRSSRCYQRGWRRGADVHIRSGRFVGPPSLLPARRNQLKATGNTGPAGTNQPATPDPIQPQWGQMCRRRRPNWSLVGRSNRSCSSTARPAPSTIDPSPLAQQQNKARAPAPV